MWIKNILNYLGKAIRSNTGISSLSLIVVLTGLLSVSLLVVICLCMLIEVTTTHTIASSLDGYAAIIGAVAGLMVSVVLPKAINNYAENKYKNADEEENTNI